MTHSLIAHASLAYHDADHIRGVIDHSGGKLIATLDDSETSTYGYLASLPSGYTVIAFRGTEMMSVQDWRTNLNRELVDTIGGRVHAGFADAFASIRRPLLASIPEGVPLLVTGHSLGGALATLAAMYLDLSGHSVAAVETFGSPRIADAEWCAGYDTILGDVTKRHVRCCDVVPKLPSAWRGYRHVGGKVYYDADGWSPDASSPWYEWLDQLDARMRHFGRLPTLGIVHHRLSSYRECIL